MDKRRQEPIHGIKCEVTDCLFHQSQHYCTADQILVKKESQKSADCLTYTKKESLE
ncbi:MAG: DUF1540 domain-containing protein [Clostridiaceae bacterium]|nr:DUF1540 domain-containing protein [Clostridiaceae bacterium]